MTYTLTLDISPFSIKLCENSLRDKEFNPCNFKSLTCINKNILWSRFILFTFLLRYNLFWFVFQASESRECCKKWKTSALSCVWVPWLGFKEVHWWPWYWSSYTSWRYQGLHQYLFLYVKLNVVSCLTIWEKTN